MYLVVEFTRTRGDCSPKGGLLHLLPSVVWVPWQHVVWPVYDTSIKRYLLLFQYAFTGLVVTCLLFHILCPFLCWVVCNYVICRNSLHILDINPLSSIYIYLLVCGLSFLFCGIFRHTIHQAVKVCAVPHLKILLYPEMMYITLWEVCNIFHIQFLNHLELIYLAFLKLL